MQQLKDKIKASAPEVLDVFNQMDKAGNGVVTRHEFRVALNDLDIKMSKKEKDNLLSMIETHGDDVLHADELDQFLNGA